VIAGIGAVALILVVALFFIFSEPKPDEYAMPQEEQQVVEPEMAEEAPAQPATRAPAPPPLVAAPRPRPAPPAAGANSQTQLPPLKVVSLGYSDAPSLRVVALRIGGGLPYFLHEGEKIGEVHVVSIMADRVQVKVGDKTYEVPVR
jgi:hypothetical protein